MKRLITILFLFPLLTLAQNKPITGPFGLKFGATKATVDLVMKKKNGLSYRANDAELASYRNVYFSTRKAYSVDYKFFQGKMFETFIFFEVKIPPQIVQQYNNLLKGLIATYGEPDNTIRDFQYPYTGEDADTWVAVKKGYATISDAWIDRTNNTAMEISISDEGGLILIKYQDSAAYEKYTASKGSDY